MTEPRRDSRWWGWGDPDVPTELGEAAERMLGERGISTGADASPPEIDRVEIPEAVPVDERVLSAAGAENVFTGNEDRIRHANGQNYLDLLELREGRLQHAPDAVIVADSGPRIAAILEACASAGVAVVPF
ncbi:MAG TPA: FAD-binding oxidoreductase, partial [Solirubrobacterales bacterium]|nr:FAD-binding oxidoreductase [Solirubrobacterales bacterium]